MIWKIVKIFIAVIITIIILLMIISQLTFHNPFYVFVPAYELFRYNVANYEINKECDKIEKENREENTKAAQEYVKERYGDALSKVIEIEYIGRRRDWAANSHYILHAQFCDDGELSVDSETHSVIGGFNFVNSPKFQHLYSEWVKKQVGIEDENVELSFSVGGIDFSNIDHLSYDMSEIYTNTKMHCYDIRVYNLKSLNYDNSYIYANKYKEDILKPLYEFTGKPEGQMTIWIHLFANNEDYGEKYYFQCSLDDMDTLERSKI